MTVKTQPIAPAQTCTVTMGAGTVASAAIANVAVSCAVPTAMAAGRFAFAANDGDGTISAYAINASTGALTAVSGSPFAAGTATTGASELKVDPSGRFLDVVNEFAHTISAFSINWTSGALTLVTGSPFTVGTVASPSSPQSLAFDATGAYLYVADFSNNNIVAFAMNASTGVLTPVAGSPFANSGVTMQPQSITTASTAAGNFAYVVNSGSGSVDVFSIAPSTGALTFVMNALTGVGPYDITIDPSGNVAYVANGGSATVSPSISSYTINAATGALQVANLGNPLPIAVSNNLSIDPQGKFLFVTETAGVAVYTFSTTTAAVTGPVTGSPFVAGSNPFSVRVDPSDQFVYVGNDVSANVSVFILNGTTGALTAVGAGPVAAGKFPDFIAID